MFIDASAIVSILNRKSRYEEIVRRIKESSSSRRDVVEFRNALIHDYDEVDVDEVWEIVTDTFPHFYQTITELLIKFDPPVPKRPKP